MSRIDYNKVAPGAFRAMFGLEKHVRDSGLEPSLLQLVKMRASQINGCAYCLDMHSKDARAEGETEQRLYVLNAWREAPFYSERERAALEWTETLTLISENHVSDELYNKVRQHFSEEELVDLSLAIVAINGWNRLSISFRADVGAYQPSQPATRSKTA
jgi:AhpD family alkylhydroperoxidase